MRLILAIALLSTCLPAQTEELYDSIYESLQKARPVLMKALEEAEGGELGLMCLAAVHDEVPPYDSVFEAAIGRLSLAELEDTYDLSLRLMVMAEHPEFPNRERSARRDYQKLIRNRVRGGFTYNQRREERWDLSNTQYGVLGLRAAETLGINVRDDVWRDLLRAVVRQQSAGGFTYTAQRPRQPSYSSMTVAGIVVMQICKQYLGQNVPSAARVDERLDDAWQWMANHVEDIGDPDARWSYYFHYGLERAAILSEVHRVGGEDWYERGVRMFVEAQGEDGSWTTSGHSDAVSTAFAVMFMRRKFRRFMTPITPGGGLGIRELDEDSSESDVQKVVDRELVRGNRAVPDMLRAMRSEVPAQRKAAVMVLLALSGSDFGFDPDLGPEENEAAIKAAEVWWLKVRDG